MGFLGQGKKAEQFHFESTPASEPEVSFKKNPYPNPWRKVQKSWRAPTLVPPVFARSGVVF